MDQGSTTFKDFPITPSSAPTTDYEVANKKYVDDNSGGGITWNTITTDTTIADKNGYIIDASVSTVTLELLTGVAGYQTAIIASDVTNTVTLDLTTNSQTVNVNGTDITADITIDITNQEYQLVCDTSSHWILTASYVI